MEQYKDGPMIEIDLRLLRAAVVVAEELNISRAAFRLAISQPGLTKQIQELEHRVGVRLFDRDTQRVELTEAGRAFAAEAGKAIFHRDRAVEVARSVARGAEFVLNVGASHYLDPLLSSALTAVHLPMYPNLRIHIVSGYSPELTHRVAVGELDLAVVAAGVESKRITAIPLTNSPLYILMERSSQLASHRELTLKDLAGVPWVIFDQKVHPQLHDSIFQKATSSGSTPSEKHDITTAELAAQLVGSTGGVAFLTRWGAWKVMVDGLTIRPLAEPGIEVRTVIAASTNASRLVGQFMRAVVKKLEGVSTPRQGKLPLAG
jgi:DNA-binding transcriptional LysR family regulator